MLKKVELGDFGDTTISICLSFYRGSNRYPRGRGDVLQQLDILESRDRYSDKPDQYSDAVGNNSKAENFLFRPIKTADVNQSGGCLFRRRWLANHVQPTR